jgi:hypothetical protein
MYSCSLKVSYIGQNFKPTQQIEVFINEDAVKQQFDYIGKGYLRNYTHDVNPEKIMDLAKKKGMEVGADAVIISDYYIRDTGGTNISTLHKSDSIGRSLVTLSSTLINPVSAKGFNILYIKYQK